MRAALLLAFAVAFVVAAGTASCSANPPCSPQVCPTGCCNAAGVCVSGGENAACGSAGNSCIDCTANVQVCGNGACVAFGAGGGMGTGGGGATGGGSATGGGGGATLCSPTPLECSDQAIQQLDLKMTVAPGGITTVADGTGFKSTVNAAGGGFPPTDSYVYARFSSTGLEKLPLGDLAALDSMDWDVAFRRYVIRINSGDSGPSCVAAQVLPVGTAYDAVSSVPSGYLPESDDFLTRAPACAFVDDGSGLGSSPRTYTATFYQYTGCVAMTGRVYVIQTRAGKHVKLTVTTYYATEAAQTTCDTSGSSGGALGGTVRVRWQFLD